MPLIEVSAGPRRIPARGKNLPSPLTSGEQRILFFEDLAPGVPLYNESEAVRLIGELHADALEQAFNLVIARHEALRSTVQTVAQGPVAIVHENWAMRMKRIDLSGLSPAEREAEVERLLIEEPRRPYHLQTQPGLRATLVRLGPSEHVLITMLHHVFCDWVSEGILWRELSSGYRAICRDEPTAQSPLPIQHGDYAVWQQQRVAEGFADELAFWEENLRGAPELLELPADRPRPSAMSHCGARQRFRLSASLTEALRNRSRQEKASLFTVFAAALNTLLYRYTGSEDILLGIPIADRRRQELQSVIGFLVHTHALRTKLSAGLTFRELLTRMRKGLLALYRRREVPFDQVVNRIQPERSLNHSPLFQVMINWRDQENHLSSIGLYGLTVESLMAETRTSKFDLTFLLTDFGAEIWVEVEYNTDLFDDDRIARMFGHYQTLLEAVAADPDRRIAELPLLTDAERGQLLFEWNSTTVEYPAGKCIHELFEEQAELNRDRVAVVFERERLTYGQLNERANRLAHHLIGLGVGPEVLVGICVERSLEMIVGLLGILKAGGAYVPLDPEYPKERLAFMLSDAEMPILLTQKRLLGRLPARNARTICLDSDWGEIAEHKPDNPSTVMNCENLAYIIYTSGSTGAPKGVQVTHANVSRLLSATQARFAFDANDVWTMFHSYAFDFSVWEIWGSLLHGGRLVVVPFLTSRSPELFRELLRKEQVTLLNQTPSAFLQQRQSDRSSKPDYELALRLIIFGGEALDFGSLKAWVARHGDEMPQLVNMYGITETTVHVTYLRIRDHLLADGAASRIGRPIPDLQVYILDPYQNPVPIGVAGELYIGGAGLARGYLKRPALNAEKFIPNPFGDNAGSRLYRTGDLGRYLRDGDIEFLGRIDQQVKIRGFRVELEEIEAVLRQHPGVSQCVVVAREDEAGDKELISYVVASPGEPAISISALRRFAAMKLPDYMIPNSCIWLEGLPLTPNGKVDRNALPAPEPGRVSTEVVYVAPRTPIEKTLARIWCKVLGLKKIGVHDDFFDLGGHSSRAVRMIAEVNLALRQKLSVAVFFNNPTIEGMARLLQPGKQAKSETRLMPFSSPYVVPIRPEGSTPPLFLLHGVGGKVLGFHELIRHLEPDQRVYGIEYVISDSEPAMLSLEGLAARYIREIRKVQPEGPYYFLGYSFGGMLVFEMAQQLNSIGQTVALLGMVDTPAMVSAGRHAPHSLSRASRRRAQAFKFHARRVFRGPARWHYIREEASQRIGELSARVRARTYARLTAWGRPIPKFLEHAYAVNWFACHQYQARRYPGRVTLFRASSVQGGVDERGYKLGWKPFAGGGVEIHEISGTHFDIIREPNVQLLARELTACLERLYEPEPKHSHLVDGWVSGDRESVPRASAAL